MKLDYDRLNDIFGSWAIMDLARACADRMDGDGDLSEALWHAMDDELIYAKDQWSLIEYYSDPSEPWPLADAFMAFHEDVMACLDTGDEDDCE